MHVSNDRHPFFCADLCGGSLPQKRSTGRTAGREKPSLPECTEVPEDDSEGSVTLYYEVYLDNLFLLDFIMNIYMLLLVNRSLGRTATRTRILLGAAYGAVIYCLVFLLPFFRIRIKFIAGLFLSVTGMAVLTFRCKKLSQFIRILSAMAGCAFFLGGIYLFLKERLFVGGLIKAGILYTAGIGLVAYLLGSRLIERGKRKKENYCLVYLQKGDKKMKVEALVDTGNSLMEPVSGKPVSILDYGLARQLFGGTLPEFYRVVPFRSIGKKNGILKCFEVPRMWIEYQDQETEYEQVYIACCEEYAPSAGTRMILNPRLMENK